MLSRFFFYAPLLQGIIAVSAKGKRDFGAGRRAGQGRRPLHTAASGSVSVSLKAVGGGTDDAPAGNRRSRRTGPAFGSAAGHSGVRSGDGVQQERSMSFFSRLIIFFSSREI